MAGKGQKKQLGGKVYRKERSRAHQLEGTEYQQESSSKAVKQLEWNTISAGKDSTVYCSSRRQYISWKEQTISRKGAVKQLEWNTISAGKDSICMYNVVKGTMHQCISWKEWNSSWKGNIQSLTKALRYCRGQILNPWLEDKVDSGMGLRSILAYRDARAICVVVDSGVE